MTTERKYWFPAKRYGWGWGLPIAWQGWVVMAFFLGLLIAGAVVILPRHSAGFFVAYALLLCLVQTAVCWLTGEPPRWRGGRL